MVPLALFFVLLTVPVLDSSGDPHQLTAKPGQDVPLHCQVPKDADIAFIVWSRPDLESMKYVLLYKENRTHENYQFSSYRGRVNQSDPKMKDGDVSVVLKNVSVNDTGTYECGVIIGGNRKPEVINTIMLNVTDSGHTAGDKGDKDGGDKDGGDINRHYGLIAAVLFVVVITVLVLILWVNKRPKNNNSADEEADPQQDTRINFLDQRTINNNFTDDETDPQRETSIYILDQRSMNHNSEQPAADEAG
ncbi:CD226 antigen-like isoform X1 [Sander lucioperca]|uniref:CD226 antigen-like isoform X1 n=1 Tax=Sander lucioperca TaxID=283035 RepID=UPI00125DB0CD|nr:CD226 antigen-like isoform X1 [Sander lucioperca]